ncbi:hypothetical protein [Agrobacterium fabrum]|uniref:hypothetical protein n=1 Tax=Agrobacterium fabrum TaxID=1176649 RepID=UPI000F0D1128|nr:hypothetical protein [Agrobacterium fabrum]AYM56736.1 hypothetical protein At1D132_07190 [Agrobacterium fabrum]NSZ11104.1 hypothetical protein [Agrobacterium fabrum]
MSEEKTTRVFVGDSLSTTHLTKNLAGGWVEKGLSTQHLTSQLKVQVQTTTTSSSQNNAPTGQGKKD